jgi:hypothetical protein
VKHHLRKEKNCLNCGTEVTDRFCSHCGQENLEPKETFSHLFAHFFKDVTHYDSKLLTTIKYLLFKPGFLSNQYFAGKRTKYLNPIRMYIFISFIFFLVLFLKKNDEPVKTNENDFTQTNIIKQHLADSLKASIQHTQNNVFYDSVKAVVTNEIASKLDTLASQKDTTEIIEFGLGDEGIKFTLKEGKYNDVAEYDSVQQTLPDDKKDKGIIHWLIRANVGLKDRYGSRSEVVVAENFEHSIPKLMFILLPLFAWFLYMFHSRKKFYYAQHAIFSVHFHSFVFLLFLLMSLLYWLFLPGRVSNYAALASVLIVFVYLSLALKNTYSQSLWLSFVKAFSVGIIYVVALVTGIIVLALISFVTA